MSWRLTDLLRENDRECIFFGGFTRTDSEEIIPNSLGVKTINNPNDPKCMFICRWLNKKHGDCHKASHDLGLISDCMMNIPGVELPIFILVLSPLLGRNGCSEISLP